MTNIDLLPKIEWISLKSLVDNTASLLVTSKSVESIADEFLSCINYVDKLLITSAQEDYMKSLPKPKSEIKKLFAIGGGRVIDIARWLAFNWKLEFIAIPTIISSDAFLVNCTGVRKDGCVNYLPSAPANLVYLDWELLQKSPFKYHTTGCGDVLSIFTGLHDWKYANDLGIAKPDEIYDSFIASMAQGILDGLISMSQEIKVGSFKGINAIITALAMEVQLCYFYGNSRPEEGGEHFFAYCVESKVPHFLHGEMVGFGILLTSYLQKQNIGPMQDFMNQVELNFRPEGLTKKIVIETLKELPEYVKKHNLRHSIYNDFKYIERAKEVEKFLNIIKLKE